MSTVGSVGSISGSPLQKILEETSFTLHATSGTTRKCVIAGGKALHIGAFSVEWGDLALDPSVYGIGVRCWLDDCCCTPTMPPQEKRFCQRVKVQNIAACHPLLSHSTFNAKGGSDLIPSHQNPIARGWKNRQQLTTHKHFVSASFPPEESTTTYMNFVQELPQRGIMGSDNNHPTVAPAAVVVVEGREEEEEEEDRRPAASSSAGKKPTIPGGGAVLGVRTPSSSPITTPPRTALLLATTNSNHNHKKKKTAAGEEEEDEDGLSPVTVVAFPTSTSNHRKKTTAEEEDEEEAGLSPVTVVVSPTSTTNTSTTTTTVVPPKPFHHHHHPMTLPPTKRDDRKVFVGGLPPDGTCSCDDTIMIRFRYVSSRFFFQ
jgi:hypothetical protein